jgi:regulator of protease activity HflC (stomatin/prohibitin superfamily)
MDPWMVSALYFVGFVVMVLIAWGLIGYPHWRVWASHQRGLADLQQAKNEQQIQIAKAQSRLDAAALNKQAAIIEAEAVAAQIQAIGDKLTTHDLYLRWQWIKMMEDTAGEHNTIYVPTEANIPILEATRLAKAITSESAGD